MEEEIKKTWVDYMIEREALPKEARRETVVEFCSKWGISDTTYYNHSNKPENWKRILEISLMSAKKECPEILAKLGEKAKAGDTKAIDMYLNYVLQLAKNLDIKTDGKPMPILANIIVKPNEISSNNSNQEDISIEEKD